MKILFGWLIFTSLLSIAIVFKAPDFLPGGESASEVHNLSSKIELLDELIAMDLTDRELLQKKRLQLSEEQQAHANDAQMDALPITSLLFALVGLNKLNILLIGIYWFVTRKRKGF